MPTLEPILVADEATKAYADLIALSPLSLSLAPGQMVALVGHNGSGKSTFLRLAAGLLELSNGSITIAGAPAGTSDARAAVSFLPDEPVLYDDLSVREHLAYVAALHGVTASASELDELIARVQLTHRADDLPARFSRGLRQKTSIALSLIRPSASSTSCTQMERRSSLPRMTPASSSEPTAASRFAMARSPTMDRRPPPRSYVSCPPDKPSPAAFMNFAQIWAGNERPVTLRPCTSSMGRDGCG